MVREIRGAKINPKSSFKALGAQNTRGRKLREQIRYFSFMLCIPGVPGWNLGPDAICVADTFRVFSRLFQEYFWMVP